MDNFNPQILKSSVGISCSECGGIFFKQAFALRRIPKTLVGSPKDVMMQIPINICTSCETPLKEDLDNLLSIDELSKKENKADSKIITG